MGRRCYISFKKEDEVYKTHIQEKLNIDMIDKSLDDPIESKDPDYIMKKIRDDYLSDSTVTIHLIGSYSAENSFLQDQTFIKRELQASLYNGENNSRNGILGIVLPSMTNNIYKGSYICSTCRNQHLWVDINDNITIKEFSINYHIPHNKCHWVDNDRYCVLVKWEEFTYNPESYIEAAFAKRSQSIASKVTVYPK